MKIVEVRRHSIRDEGPHLSKEGIELADKVGKTLEKAYSYYVSSPKERAVETLEAFGIVDFEVSDDFLSVDDSELKKHKQKTKEIASEKGISKFEASFLFPEGKEALIEMGKTFLENVKKVANKIKHGEKALIVSHGGSIEPAALLGFDEFSLHKMGGPLDCCEGVIFFFDEQNQLQDVKIKRIDQ